jgi:nicotinamidase/pyrazinamidase
VEVDRAFEEGGLSFNWWNNNEATKKMNEPIPHDKSRSVLLLIDLQADFLPGGALAVGDGDAILGPIRELLESRCFEHVVATQDWHPRGHISFASSHSGHQPFETVELYGEPQVLWPDHCVQGTPGADFDPRVPWEYVQSIVRKGTDPTVDSYSGFQNNWNAQHERPPTGLGGFLRELCVEDVFICGLARDYCVKWSAEDAADLGFSTHVLWDLTRPVDPGSNEDVSRALDLKGISVMDSAALRG